LLGGSTNVPHNMALDPAPFGRWTLRDEAAQRRSALRCAQGSWQRAEDHLCVALRDYGRAAKATYQGRLFAQDALEGLRLIDLTREAFDVVGMNPPYGALSTGVMADLGHGVMDDARCEAAAYVLRKSM